MLPVRAMDQTTGLLIHRWPSCPWATFATDRWQILICQHGWTGGARILCVCWETQSDTERIGDGSKRHINRLAHCLSHIVTLFHPTRSLILHHCFAHITLILFCLFLFCQCPLLLARLLARCPPPPQQWKSTWKPLLQRRSINIAPHKHVWPIYTFCFVWQLHKQAAGWVPFTLIKYREEQCVCAFL